MMKKPMTTKAPAEQVVKHIRRATRKLHSSEEKIRIVLSGLRGEDSIAELCRKEGIAQSLYYSWSKEFLEAGKKRLAVAFYIADSEDLSPANGGGGGEIRTRFTHRRQPFKPVATRA